MLSTTAKLDRALHRHLLDNVTGPFRLFCPMIWIFFYQFGQKSQNSCSFVLKVPRQQLNRFIHLYYPPYVSMEGSIGCCFFLSPVTGISATVAPIGVKFCSMDISVPDRSSPFLGAVPPGDPQIRNFGPKF